MTDEERSEQVVLVNERDEETGRMGKLEAHQQGLLHRAFSVFVFHPDGRLLLQRRGDGNDKGDLPGCRESRGIAEDALFHDPELYMPVGEFLLEP